jgi:hypothetical protein
VIELLAITDDATPPPPPLRAVHGAGLSALCGPAATGGDPDAAALWRHEEVLEELMEGRDLLPVRFGTRLADDGEAAAILVARRDEFAAGLDRVRGAVELALRVRADAEPTAPPMPEDAGGRAYLAAKVARTRSGDALHAPLAALARESAIRPGPELLRSAYLVDRAAVTGFVAAVRELQAAHPDLSLLCTGPWPPYSFVAEQRSR